MTYDEMCKLVLDEATETSKRINLLRKESVIKVNLDTSINDLKTLKFNAAILYTTITFPETGEEIIQSRTIDIDKLIDLDKKKDLEPFHSAVNRKIANDQTHSLLDIYELYDKED